MQTTCHIQRTQQEKITDCVIDFNIVWYLSNKRVKKVLEIPFSNGKICMILSLCFLLTHT